MDDTSWWRVDIYNDILQSDTDCIQDLIIGISHNCNKLTQLLLSYCLKAPYVHFTCYFQVWLYLTCPPGPYGKFPAPAHLFPINWLPLWPAVSLHSCPSLAHYVASNYTNASFLRDLSYHLSCFSVWGILITLHVICSCDCMLPVFCFPADLTELCLSDPAHWKLPTGRRIKCCLTCHYLSCLTSLLLDPSSPFLHHLNIHLCQSVST